jgi:hypothetical protein
MEARAARGVSAVVGHEIEFVCEDCGINVVQFGYHDGLKVCGVCRFIRSVPDMPEKTKRFLLDHACDTPPEEMN